MLGVLVMLVMLVVLVVFVLPGGKADLRMKTLGRGTAGKLP